MRWCYVGVRKVWDRPYGVVEADGYDAAEGRATEAAYRTSRAVIDDPDVESVIVFPCESGPMVSIPQYRAARRDADLRRISQAGGRPRKRYSAVLSRARRSEDALAVDYMTDPDWVARFVVLDPETRADYPPFPWEGEEEED